MKLIVCLDDQNGMLFNNRRLSKDSCLRKRLLEQVKDGNLWMNAYSAGQFTEESDAVRVCEDYLAKAGTEDFCFLENADICPYIDRVEQLIVYRWNRLYPSDTVFPFDKSFVNWKKVSSFDFPGSSHEKLTEEVYLP